MTATPVDSSTLVLFMLLLSQLLYLHYVIICVLCEQRVKQIYEDVEKEPPVYFYMEYEADVIAVNCERSTWPLENFEPVHQV